MNSANIRQISERPFAAIPSNIEELLNFSTACPCGEVHRSDLQAVAVRNGALDDLPPMMKRIGAKLKILVVADRVTNEIAGNLAADLLKRDGHTVAVSVVQDGTGGRPHADDKTLAVVEHAISEAGADAAVAVGSGTINDLTKLAAFNAKIPYAVVATAPSMNGYTSAIAAMMIHGLKCTVPCAQPFGVVADLDILNRAPTFLFAAGLGDLESKPTASSDYRLGALVRGDAYCRAPESVVRVAEQRAAESAHGLPSRDPEAVQTLSEALILSGISMKLAGSSGPASGGEHLISHFWDMTAEAENRTEGFHGAQVGVATVVTAALYEHLARLNPADIDPEALVATRPTAAQERAVIDSIHGKFGEETAAQYRQKRPSDDLLKERLDFLKSDWRAIVAALQDSLRPADRIRSTLRAAGAPTAVDELGLTPDHLRRAFRYARHIRNRYTVLDAAFDLGILDRDAETILRRSGCLG